MNKENLGIFTIDGEKYPIKRNVYNFVKSYFHKKRQVHWVHSEEPYILIGVKSQNMNEIKTIKREIK